MADQIKLLCPACDGTGQKAVHDGSGLGIVDEPCETCKGNRWVPAPELDRLVWIAAQEKKLLSYGYYISTGYLTLLGDTKVHPNHTLYKIGDMAWSHRLTGDSYVEALESALRYVEWIKQEPEV